MAELNVTKDMLFSRLACENRPEYSNLFKEYEPSYRLDRYYVSSHPILKQNLDQQVNLVPIKKSTIHTVTIRKTQNQKTDTEGVTLPPILLYIKVIISLDLGGGLLLYYGAEYRADTPPVIRVFPVERAEVEQNTDWYKAVYQFTELVNDGEINREIKPMTESDIEFLIRMVLSELDELLATVQNGSDKRTRTLQQLVLERDYTRDITYETYLEQASHQADAMVDYIYYTLNCASRSNLELNQVFQMVHQANMAKRDHLTGKFIRRKTDGKIMKPTGWQAPDIYGLLRYQSRERKLLLDSL